MPTLSLEPTTKTKHIPNVEVWTSAFQVFVGVYTSKYPGDAPAFMKYGEVVKDLAAGGGAIGAIMTLSSSFYVPRKQMKCHGLYALGNMDSGTEFWQFY